MSSWARAGGWAESVAKGLVDPQKVALDLEGEEENLGTRQDLSLHCYFASHPKLFTM